MAESKTVTESNSSLSAATMLLRELIDSSEAYSKLVGSKLEVNETDFAAMRELIEAGPMTAGQLAQAVGISAGSATVMIDRLVAVGHVTREANPKDRRGVVVVPNPKSVKEAWKHISPLIEGSELLLAKFSDSERKAIEEYLSSMISIYKSSK